MNKIIKILTDEKEVKEIESGEADRFSIVDVEVELKGGSHMIVSYSRDKWRQLKLMTELVAHYKIPAEKLEELCKLAYREGYNEGYEDGRS